MQRWRATVARRGLLTWLAYALLSLGAAQPSWGQATQATQSAGETRLVSGRFTFVATPRDERLAHSLMASALAQDTFPGLPRPRDSVLIAIASDAAQFRALVGGGAPEWGAAIAIPDERRIVMQGSSAGSDAGEPRGVLRHELAHLALHEAMGRLPPRWFDEGYASMSAGEWTRESAFETSLRLVWHTLPTRDSLEAGFYGGASRAEWSYAVARRVVAELAAIDEQNGLRNFFVDWKSSGSFEVGIRQAFGMTGQQFDDRWRSRTRRQYGGIAFVANLSLVVGLFGLLLGPLFYMRRKRDRRKLEAMRAADAAQEQALRESALEALLATETDEIATGPL